LVQIPDGCVDEAKELVGRAIAVAQAGNKGTPDEVADNLQHQSDFVVLMNNIIRAAGEETDDEGEGKSDYSSVEVC